MKKITLIIMLILLSSFVYCQPPHWKLGGNPAGGVDGMGVTTNFLGSALGNNIPIRLGTDGITRMFIQANSGLNPGYIGIGSTNPLFRLHIDASATPDATSLGWKKGLLLSGSAALMWEGSPITGFNYFMAHPASTPTGDFFQGISSGIGTGAGVNYASKVNVASGSPGPQASTQIFKWLLVEEGGFERRFGVNTLNPSQVAEIKSNTAGTWQMRLTNLTGAWTDFQTRNTGNLNILPQNGNTGFNMNLNPTHTIDVNGNARIRTVLTDPTPNFILLGNPLATNDMEVQKLAFSGNPTDVLMGDGTFGPVSPTALNANNGLSIFYGLSTPFVQWGQDCSAPGNPAGLLNDREIPWLNKNIYFTGQGIPTTNAMGLGYTCGAPMPAKFNVFQRTATPILVSTTAGHFLNSDFGAGSTSSLTFIGVFGKSDQPQVANNTNIGGDFVAERARICYAVRGRAAAGGAEANGGRFTATVGSSAVNIGVYGEASAGVVNYAIYGTVSTIDPIPGTLPPSSGSYAGYFNGSVLRTGLDNFSSDATLKTNIDTIPSAMSIINSLKPKTFFYDTTNAYGMVFSSRRQYGFLAQDVETILPELVSSAINPGAKDTMGTEVIAPHTFKTLQYQSFTALLTKGMQEQQKTIESLTNQVATLTACIETAGLCETSSMLAPSSGTKKSTDIELKDSKDIILEQNVPNPFAEMTTITYALNDGVQKAQMLFYNASGKLIKSVDLDPIAGKQELNVFTSELSNGMYTYTMVVDGKIMGTKRMVKNK